MVAWILAGYAAYLLGTHTSTSNNNDDYFDRFITQSYSGQTKFNTKAVQCAKTYRHTDGRSELDEIWAFEGGETIKNWMDSGHNDEISSVKVWDGCYLTVYEHWYREGKSKTFSHKDMTDKWVKNLVSIGWNDRVSSYDCHCEAWRYKGGRRLEKLQSDDDELALAEHFVVRETHAIRDPLLPPMDVAGVPFTKEEFQLSRKSSSAMTTEQPRPDFQSLEGIVVVADTAEELEQIFASAMPARVGRKLHIWKTFRPVATDDEEDSGMIPPPPKENVGVHAEP